MLMLTQEGICSNAGTVISAIYQRNTFRVYIL